MDEPIHEWIIRNLELANSLGDKGLVPFEVGYNNISFQKVDYPVKYHVDDASGALVRTDYIRDKMPMSRLVLKR